MTNIIRRDTFTVLILLHEVIDTTFQMHGKFHLREDSRKCIIVSGVSYIPFTFLPPGLSKNMLSIFAENFNSIEFLDIRIKKKTESHRIIEMVLPRKLVTMDKIRPIIGKRYTQLQYTCF